MDITEDISAQRSSATKEAMTGPGRRGRIVERLASPTRVRDLACRTGILACAVRERFLQCELVGVDLAADDLDIAKQRAKRRSRTLT